MFRKNTENVSAEVGKLCMFLSFAIDRFNHSNLKEKTGDAASKCYS
jgi:hypothetical protein